MARGRPGRQPHRSRRRLPHDEAAAGREAAASGALAGSGASTAFPRPPRHRRRSAGARRAGRDHRHPDHRTAVLIGRALWEHHLLQVLAGFEGAEELSRIDDQWRAHVAAWNDLVRWLRAQDGMPEGRAAAAGRRGGGAARRAADAARAGGASGGDAPAGRGGRRAGARGGLHAGAVVHVDGGRRGRRSVAARRGDACRTRGRRGERVPDARPAHRRAAERSAARAMGREGAATARRAWRRHGQGRRVDAAGTVLLAGGQLGGRFAVRRRGRQRDRVRRPAQLCVGFLLRRTGHRVGARLGGAVRQRSAPRARKARSTSLRAMVDAVGRPKRGGRGFSKASQTCRAPRRPGGAAAVSCCSP